MKLRPAILGAADGLVSVSGLVAAGLGSGSHHFFVARLGMAAAASGTVSMANAQFASEGQTDWGSVGSMGAGTLCGAAIPVLPLFALGGMFGIAAVTVAAVLVAAAVAVVRQRVNRKRLGWNLATTYAGLALGIAVGLATGG